MAHFCPGICVFFTADLYGGGIRLENDYLNFVKERYGQVESLFEWVQKKNLKALSSIIMLIIFGILAQLGIIPKLIT